MMKRPLSGLLIYIPGLVILIFGMLALHSSLMLINQKQELSKSLYGFPTLEHELKHSALDFITLSPNDKNYIAERRLYWSVIALGLCGFVLLLLNADKLKKISAANEEKKETFQLLEKRLAAMEAASDGIAILDRNDNIIYLNNAFKRLHGLQSTPESEYLNKPWQTLYTEDSARILARDIKPSTEKDGYWRGETTLKCNNGTVLQMELSLTELPDGGMIGTIRDISKSKQAQEEKEVMQMQFFQAQKMEAVGRLAGGVAHDFNNILAAINGYAEFLKEDLDKETPQHKFSDNILKAGFQAKSLVDQILEFSRVQSENFETFDFSEPVKECILMLEASVPKSVEISYDLATDHVPVFGNATNISQTLLNLCVNAQDALPEEKGKIEISSKLGTGQSFAVGSMLRKTMTDPSETLVPIIEEDRESGKTRLTLGSLCEDQQYIMLSVKDSGSGMSTEVLEHIFEPFFTTKPVDKGTGLGLASVHGIVRNHRGAIIINTKLGLGTEFLVFFPASEENVVPLAPEVSEYDKDILKDIHVMLVEDQQEVADMSVVMLQRIGVKVTHFISALTALEELKQDLKHYNLLITDQNMPEMMGTELIEEVTNQKMDLPIMLLSGYATDKLKAAIKDNPAIHAILRKPVKQEELSKHIILALPLITKQIQERQSRAA